MRPGCRKSVGCPPPWPRAPCHRWWTSLIPNTMNRNRQPNDGQADQHNLGGVGGALLCWVFRCVGSRCNITILWHCRVVVITTGEVLCLGRCCKFGLTAQLKHLLWAKATAFDELDSFIVVVFVLVCCCCSFVLILCVWCCVSVELSKVAIVLSSFSVIFCCCRFF